MEKEKERLAKLKKRVSNTSSTNSIQQDYPRASLLSHIIDRIELVEEAIEEYVRTYPPPSRCKKKATRCGVGLAL